MVALGGGMHGCLGGVCGCVGGGHVWDTTRYGDTVNERAVRILLECILVLSYLLASKESNLLKLSVTFRLAQRFSFHQLRHIL